MSDQVVEIFVVRVSNNCLSLEPNIQYRVVNSLHGIHSTGETVYEFLDYSYCCREDYNDELNYIMSDIDSGAYDNIEGTKL